MNCKNFVSRILLACVLFFSSTADAKEKFPAPVPTTEFEKMAYAPVYPTYSWEVLPNTEFYQVQVGRDEEILYELKNVEALNRVTDWRAFTEEGNFFWRVRAVDKKNRPLSDWSEKKFFTVTLPVKYAVLGDSISHGGANFIPAGQISCQWETFCSVPIKNIARSGDTTSMLIERFDRDVLPFKPKFLLIMGGINDIREGKTADEVIKNLETLREKCLTNDITPIFGTLTPMNEKIIRDKKIFLTDRDWRNERQKVNDWILQNEYAVDISLKLYDNHGELHENFTPDGLHPDMRGKKFIGETVENYLTKKFEVTE